MGELNFWEGDKRQRKDSLERDVGYGEAKSKEGHDDSCKYAGLSFIFGREPFYL